MSIDYNSRNRSAGKGGRKSVSFRAFAGITPKPHGKVSGRGRLSKLPTVTRGGGGDPAPGNRGTSGLHLNKVSRRVNTGRNKTKTVTSGGGHTSLRNIRGNTDVAPEN